MLIYEGTTVLDWIGPYEALHRVPGIEVVLAGKTTDLMKSDSGIVSYKANVALDAIERTDVEAAWIVSCRSTNITSRSHDWTMASTASHSGSPGRVTSVCT
jgi:putative intracellular protease/amidase